MNTLPLPPRSAVFVRPDTLGDLILFLPALKSLRAAWPRARFAVVIRQPYVGLAGQLAPDIEWIGTTIDVFREGPDASAAELDRLRAMLAARAPDLVVGACAQRNWLESALAAAAPSARRLVLGSAGEDAFFGGQLRARLGVAAGPAAFGEAVPYRADAPDWERNFALADALLGHRVAPVAPSWTLTPALLTAADETLRTLQLAPGGFIACAAAGFAQVRLKTWPAERFGAVLAEFYRRHGVRALLVGAADERPHLEAVQAAAGPEAARIWTGGAEDLPRLAGLLARSAFFLGNDTGALHLAAALGRPVVGIYGGGTWPRFAPASRQAIALVHPLPCFGCGWDCAFGDAPCISAVGVEAVQAALEDVLRLRHDSFYELRELRALPAAMVELMGRAAALARERTEALRARQQKIEGLEAERQTLQAACDERLALINRLTADVEAMRVERDKALTHIKNLEAR